MKVVAAHTDLTPPAVTDQIHEEAAADSADDVIVPSDPYVSILRVAIGPVITISGHDHVVTANCDGAVPGIADQDIGTVSPVEVVVATGPDVTASRIAVQFIVPVAPVELVIAARDDGAVRVAHEVVTGVTAIEVVVAAQGYDPKYESPKR